MPLKLIMDPLFKDTWMLLLTTLVAVISYWAKSTKDSLKETDQRIEHDLKDCYVTTDPEINIFQSAILMEDGSTREWGCRCEGEKVIITLTKSDLLSLANHYEQRKNAEYNQCDKRRSTVDALTTIEEVEAYDITTVYP